MFDLNFLGRQSIAQKMDGNLNRSPIKSWISSPAEIFLKKMGDENHEMFGSFQSTWMYHDNMI